MIDLHSHILPGIDDGAADLAVSIEMARRFESQGIVCVACTPHILPGVYHNTGPQIRSAVAALQDHLREAGLSVHLIAGADNHIVPDFVDGLRRGHLLALGDTRYVLVEPPHHIAPPRMDELFFNIIMAGYVPILTHPERLSWIEEHYDRVVDLARRGVWVQVTSGALLGRFGRRAKYWAERMLAEGLVHILASDAHGTDRRPPDLAEGYLAAERRIGRAEADNMVVVRPEGVILDRAPADLPPVLDVALRGTGAGGENGRKVPGSRDRGGVFGRMRSLFAQ
jgi:protein-tyrosine phosphatase